MTTERDVFLKLGQLIGEQSQQKNLPITDYALNKAKAYAKVVCALASEVKNMNSGWECYGYLLKEDWSLDDVVDEVCFARNQDMTSAYVHVSAEGVQTTSDEVSGLGYQIVGWWHSHGNMTVFHSGTDVRNFITVAHSVAPSTMYYAEKAQPFQENGFVYVDNIRIAKAPAVNVESSANGGAGNGMEILRKQQRNPFAYSLVVNKRGDEYVERHEKELKTGQLLRPEIVKTYVVSDDRTFSIQDIERDVREKLGLRPRTKQKALFYTDKFITGFVDKCLEYLSNGSEQKIEPLEKFLNGIGAKDVSRIFDAVSVEEQPDSTHSGNEPADASSHQASAHETAQDSRNNPINHNVTHESLKQKLKQTMLLTRPNNGYTIDANDMHVKLLARFMKRFDAQSYTGKNFDLYSSIAQTYNDAHANAIEMTRALCTYAQQPLTNGKNNLEDATRLNYLLSRMNEEHRVSVSGSAGYVCQSSNIFLYHDRQRIYRQFFGALVQDNFTQQKNEFLNYLLGFSREIAQDMNKPMEVRLKTMSQMTMHPAKVMAMTPDNLERMRFYGWK